MTLTTGIPHKLAHPDAQQAAAYYVSPDGKDEDPGTLEKPWRSLSAAAVRLKAGDTLYVRGGIYQEDVHFAESGTAEAPITIAAYPGETPVIDGNSFQAPALYWGALVMVSGAYNSLSGFEVRGSNYMGVMVSGEHSSVSGFNVHHNMENGIFLSGNYTLAEKNVIWMNCLSNEGGSFSRSSWASGLSAGRAPNFAVMRGNVVYNNFGEGLSTFEANGTVIEGNRVYDNWSANIYISDATNITLNNNFVYVTESEIMQTGDQVGIMLGDETYEPPSANITISGNTVYGAHINFYWWQGVQGGGMQDVLITHNSFIGSRENAGIQMNVGIHQNARFIRNAIIQNDMLPIVIAVPHEGLIMDDNLWSKAPALSARGSRDLIFNGSYWPVFIRWTGRGSVLGLDEAAELAGYRTQDQPSLYQSLPLRCGFFTFDRLNSNFCR